MAHQLRPALLKGLVALLTPPGNRAFAFCAETAEGKGAAGATGGVPGLLRGVQGLSPEARGCPGRGSAGLQD